MIRVLLVEDHACVRAGLHKILEEASDIEVVGEASSGEEAVALTRRLHSNVVVMDNSMPGIGGLEATKRIARKHPEMAILILTVYPEGRYGPRFFRAGARGYIEKKVAPDELMAAIRRVHHGGYYLSPKLQEELLRQQFSKAPAPLMDRLTDRELEVLILIASGKMTNEAAKELKLSSKTVETYRARIRKKLGLHTSAEYLYFALEHDLLPELSPRINLSL